MTKLQWEWRESYRVALLETNPMNILERLAAAEEAIFSRILELSVSAGGKPERQAIADAVSVLSILRRDRKSADGAKTQRRSELGANVSPSA
jgi:hypothetical protein